MNLIPREIIEYILEEVPEFQYNIEILPKIQQIFERAYELGFNEGQSQGYAEGQEDQIEKNRLDQDDEVYTDVYNEGYTDAVTKIQEFIGKIYDE